LKLQICNFFVLSDNPKSFKKKFAENVMETLMILVKTLTS